MARPLRLEFRNALYHVTSRGDQREDIFVSDTDSVRFFCYRSPARLFYSQ